MDDDRISEADQNAGAENGGVTPEGRKAVLEVEGGGADGVAGLAGDGGTGEADAVLRRANSVLEVVVARGARDAVAAAEGGFLIVEGGEGEPIRGWIRLKVRGTDSRLAIATGSVAVEGVGAGDAAGGGVGEAGIDSGDVAVHLRAGIRMS